EFFLNLYTDDFLQRVTSTFLTDSSYTLTFSDFTPLFDVQPIIGTIQFTPKERDIGTHTILLKIDDTKENVEYVSFQLVIS
ncbi:MAG: hypothetical protein AABX82_01020, partial [Nanoarchaeota archaeon]